MPSHSFTYQLLNYFVSLSIDSISNHSYVSCKDGILKKSKSYKFSDKTSLNKYLNENWQRSMGIFLTSATDSQSTTNKMQRFTIYLFL